MSNSLDNINGWELFNTPFSSPVRTATAPPRQQTGRPQQQPSEVMQHNTIPTAAQRNSSPTQTAPQPVHQMAQTQQKTSTAKQSNPALSTPAPASDKQSTPKAPTPAPVRASSTKQEPIDSPKAPAPAQAAPTKQEPVTSPKVPANTQPVAPQKELTLDMSSGAGTAPIEDNTAKRKAHEEAEAKRKAEWEAKQAAKKQAEEAALQKINAMSDADIIAAAARRVSMDTERLTRRNMKECVAEHIQSLCKTDTAFARKAMHPRKTMIKCFKYINRMAKEYVRQEMQDNDIQPDGTGYGTDIPDGLCYQWAEDYFNSTDAPEDQETEEKFTPKPYTGTPSKPAKQKPKKQQKKPSDNYEQMSLEGVMG